MSAVSSQQAGIDDTASTEDRHVALQLWWDRNGSSMSKWFESLTKDEQIIQLRKASPDIPTQIAGTRELEGQKLNASDVLLPELTIDGLLGVNGKLLSLFFMRRCQQADRCYFADLQLLNAMFRRDAMPLFSQGALDQMDTPFVDPADREENVRTLNASTPQDNRAAVLAHLISGRLIHADVFITLKIRRAALVNFMAVIVESFERDHIGAVSPTLSALLKGELDQQRVTQEMAEEEQQAVEDDDDDDDDDGDDDDKDDEQRAEDVDIPLHE
jgi:hypothetical protein